MDFRLTANEDRVIDLDAGEYSVDEAYHVRDIDIAVHVCVGCIHIKLLRIFSKYKVNKEHNIRNVYRVVAIHVTRNSNLVLDGFSL